MTATLRASPRPWDRSGGSEQARPLQATAADEPELTETLIDIFKRGEFTEVEIQYANGFSQKTQQLAALIAQLEKFGGRADQERAQRLRAGEPIGDPFNFVDDAISAAGTGIGFALGASDAVIDAGFDATAAGIDLGVEAGRAVGDAADRGLRFGIDAAGAGAALTVDLADDAVRVVVDTGAEVTEFTIDGAVEFAELTGDRIEDLREVRSRLERLARESPDAIIGLLDYVITGGCVAKEWVHQALLGFVTSNPHPDAPVDEWWAARIADGLKGKRFDGENNRWLEIYSNDPWGRDKLMASFAEWVTDPVTVAEFCRPAARRARSRGSAAHLGGSPGRVRWPRWLTSTDPLPRSRLPPREGPRKCGVWYHLVFGQAYWRSLWRSPSRVRVTTMHQTRPPRWLDQTNSLATPTRCAIFSGVSSTATSRFLSPPGSTSMPSHSKHAAVPHCLSSAHSATAEGCSAPSSISCRHRTPIVDTRPR